MMDRGVKMSHFSYVGDSEVGAFELRLLCRPNDQGRVAGDITRGGVDLE